MAIYQGVSGVNREVKQIFQGVGGVNREVKERWEGVAGVNRRVFNRSDPNTVLLLHGDNFADCSKNAITFSNNGGIVIADNCKFGKGFYNPDGKQFLYADNLQISLTDFTVETWLYLLDTSESGIIQSTISAGNMDLRIFLDSYNGKCRLMCQFGKEVYRPVTSIPISELLNKWKHFAVVRKGNLLYFFIDGVLGASTTVSQAVVRFNEMYLFAEGTYDNRQLGVNGYIDEFRLSDIARWTGDFPLPAEPYSY